MKVELTLEEIEIIIEQFRDKPTYPDKFRELGYDDIAQKHERLKIVYQSIVQKLEEVKDNV